MSPSGTKSAPFESSYLSLQSAAAISLTVTRNAAGDSSESRPLLFNVKIDPVTMEQAVQRIYQWIDARRVDCPFVVTPNVDHVVQLHRQPDLLPAYRSASLTVADGWPLVTVSRWLGVALPERVPGSDLLPNLLQSLQSRNTPTNVFLLGGMPGVADRAAREIEATWPWCRIVGTSSPPLGFENDSQLNEQICCQVNTSEADLLVVGLGFPKQENWLHAHQATLNVAAAMAVGATIDFIAGEQTRAPKWVRRIRSNGCIDWRSNPRRWRGGTPWTQSSFRPCCFANILASGRILETIVE